MKSLERFLNTKIFIVIFVFVLVAIILFPVIVGKKVVGTDSLELIIPQLSFYKYSLETNQSPFWNPFVAVGFPNFVSISGFPYLPFNFLLYFLSPVTVHYFGLFIMLFWAMFFFILFCKKIGLGWYGSMMGSMAYIMGNIFFVRDLVLATALFVQSFLFWIIISAFQSNFKKQIFLFISSGGLAVGYAWLSASYFPTLYIFIALFSFSIFLGLRNTDDNLNKNKKRKLLKAFYILLAIFLVGTIIGSLQLVPTYIMNKYSQRSSGLEVEQAHGFALGLKELFNFTHLTIFRGMDAYLYIGIFPLIFLVISFFIRRNSFVSFFKWFFLIVLAISIKHSPLFWLIIHLPLFNFFQGAARFMIIGIFAAAVLVGYGFEYFVNLSKEPRENILKVMIPTISIIVILIIISIVLWLSNKEEIQSIAFSVLFLIIFLLAVNFLLKKPLIMIMVLLTITSVDFIFTYYRFNRDNFIDRAIYEKKPEALEFIAKKPGRILPMFVDDWDNLFFEQVLKSSVPESTSRYTFSVDYPTFRPSYQLLNQVENLEINDPLLNVNMGRLLTLLGTRQLVTTGGEQKLNKVLLEDENGNDISVIERLRIFKERMPLVNFLGIKYLLTPFSLEDQKIDKIILPIYGIVPIKFYGLSNKDPVLMMNIYENPDAMPIAYFSKVSSFLSDNNEIYKMFKLSGFKEVFVECKVNCPEKIYESDGNVLVKKKENGKVKLKTISQGDRFLILTQNFLPGWNAYIDGNNTQIYKVNTVFAGIFIPPGEHDIEFKYEFWGLFNPKFIFSK